MIKYLEVFLTCCGTGESQSHLHSVCFLFHEQLLIDFGTIFFWFLDPLDPN